MNKFQEAGKEKQIRLIMLLILGIIFFSSLLLTQTDISVQNIFTGLVTYGINPPEQIQPQADYSIPEPETPIEDPEIEYTLPPPEPPIQYGKLAAPNQTTPILNSTSGNNYTTDNLTCYNQSTYDADNDTVKNIYNWKKDGSYIMVLNMPFEPDGNLNATDYSGNGNNATAEYATYNPTGGHDSRGAYEFDGVNDYIDAFDVPVMSQFTFEFWIKPNSHNYGGILSDHKSGAWYPSYHHVISSKVTFRFYKSNANDWDGVTSLSNLSIGKWNHVVGTYNGSALKVYINGTLDNSASASGTPWSNSNRVVIGADSIAGGSTINYFNGTIDEFRIYNYALSPEQIKALYENKTNTIVSQETDYNEIWQCEITPNDGTSDGSTNSSNNLTIEGLWPNCPNATANGIWNIDSDYTITDDVVCEVIKIYDNATLYVDSRTAGNRSLWINCTNMTIFSGSSIDSTGKGYLGGTLDGAGKGPGGGKGSFANGGGGAGHGGYGGNSHGGTSGGKPYGSSLQPTTLGSGGGDGNGENIEAKGGGAIKIHVSDTFNLNGTVKTNGKKGLDMSYQGCGGGGAGGSIWVTTNTLSGAGNFSAKGGNGGTGSQDGGGGAGGRIAVYFNVSSDLLQMLTSSRVTGGSGGGDNAKDGEEGTLAFVDQNNNKLYIYEGFRWQSSDATDFNYNLINITNADTRINGSVSINSSTDINLINSLLDGEATSFNLTLTATGSISLTNSSINILNQTPISSNNLILQNSASLSRISNLTIDVINLTVDASSSIKATGAGYLGGTLDGAGKGPGGGKGSFANGGGGAGHGGFGGNSNAGTLGGIPYGSSLQPTTLGSGGGDGNGENVNAKGGGAIKILVSDTFNLNGTIESAGNKGFNAPSSGCGGGGAGGSIWVTTKTLSGTGNFSAKGGAGGTGTGNDGGGGAGGRIAVYFNASSDFLQMLTSSRITGGSGGGDPNAKDGEPGTLAFIDVPNDYLYSYEGFRFQENDLDGTTRFHTMNISTNNARFANETGVVINATYFNLINSNLTDDKTTTYTYKVYANNTLFDSNSRITLDGRLWITLLDSFSDTNTNYSKAMITLEDQPYGIIEWIPSLTSFSNLSTETNITNNSIFADSAAQSVLNTSANITIYIDTSQFYEPTPYVAYDDSSFQLCSHCTEISDTGTAYTFNTTRFTTYQLDHSPPNTTQVLVNSTNGTNHTDEDLTCYAEGEGAENLTAYWKWYKDNILNLSGSTNITNGTLTNISTIDSSSTTKEDNWTCSARMYSTLNETNWNNASILILNKLPEHGTPILNSTSGTNYSSENLTCHSQSTTDADNDTVKNIYNWYRNGTSIMALNMPFEPGETTNAKDYSGNGNNGTVYGSPVYNMTAGYGNSGAYNLDGSDDYVQIPDALYSESSMTIAAWIYPKSFHSTQPKMILSKRRSGGNEWWFVTGAGTTSAPLSFSAWDAISAVRGVNSASVQNLSLNQWQHIAVVLNSTHTSLFINGNYITSTAKTGTMQNTASKINIGKCSEDNTCPSETLRFFNGIIDEVQIYPLSLSAEQIKALYQNRTDLIVSNETTVGETWKCEITPNDQDPDGITKQSNNLTIQSPPAAYPNCPGATGNGIWNIDSDYTITDDVVCEVIKIYDNATLYVDSRTAGNRSLWINCTNITVFSGSSIDSTGKGYAGGTSGVLGGDGSGPGGGQGSNLTGAGGAGHGGSGGNSEISGPRLSLGGSPYNSSILPLDIGSGGGGGRYTVGGDGGGGIKIHVNDTFVLNGTIETNGENGATYYTGYYYSSGAGAGGTIYVVTGTLKGSGNFSAKGGNGANSLTSDGDSGGGAGGRIVIYFNESTLSNWWASDVSGGIKGGNAYNGQPGTLVFIDVNDNILYPVNNFRFQPEDVSPTGFFNYNINMTDSAYVIVGNVSSGDSRTITFNGSSFVMSNSSFYNYYSGIYYNLTILMDEIAINSSIYNFKFVNISTDNLTIGSSGNIITDYCGYAGGTAGKPAGNGTGPGGGEGGKKINDPDPPTGGAGAGHGGYGGHGQEHGSVQALGGDAYGYSLTPLTLGSGGGGGHYYQGGAGGGMVKIDVSNLFTLDGTIEADGADTSRHGLDIAVAGAGSGGTIHVITYNLTGSGNFSAKGGTGGNTTVSGGGGGSGAGGRIIVYFNESTLSDMSASDISGGINLGGGHNGYPGDPGTLAFIDVPNNYLLIYNGFRWQTNDNFDGTSTWPLINVTGAAARFANETGLIINATYFNLINSNLTDDKSTTYTQKLAANYTTFDSNSRITLDGRLWITLLNSFTDTNADYTKAMITLEDQPYGIIEWIPSLTSFSNLSTETNITNNSIFADSAAQSGLNKSANITIYINVSQFAIPQIQVAYDDTSFQNCTHCTELADTGTYYIFNTTRFTTYQLGEAPVAQQPPNQTQPILNSSSGTNHTDENLTCYNQSTYDANNDTVKNIYNWKKDGSSIMALHMPFEAHSGDESSVAKDYSSNENNGTVTGGATWNESYGYDGFGAYDFDGDNDYIDISNDASLEPSELTACLRFYNTDETNHQYPYILSMGDHASGNGAEFSGYFITLINNDDIRGFVYTGTNTARVAGPYTASLQENRWYHACITYSDPNLILYLDGVQVANNTDGGTLDYTGNNDNLRIGMASSTTIDNNAKFDGRIDDVRIYNKAFSPEQIQALYQNKTNLIVSQETAKGQTWQCEITPNDGTEDGSTNSSNNLTIINKVPEHGTPILNSSSGTNYTSENLTCYNTSTTDADADPVKNIYNWYKNGQSIMVLNMPFEPSGTLNATDYSSRGNNASSVSGNPIYNLTGGYSGAAYDFDGSGDYITITDDTSLDLTNAITISAWVKWDSGTGYQDIVRKTGAYILQKMDSGNSHQIRWIVYRGAGAGSTIDLQTGDALPSGQWSHLAVTFDGSTAYAYLNGAEIGSSSSSITIATNNNNLGIGADIETPGQYFNGIIDEVKIYNIALSEEQIIALNNSRPDLIVSQETTIGENWTCEITPNDLDPDGITKKSNNVTIRPQIKLSQS